MRACVCIGYDVVKAWNPNIIYASNSGFGPTGEWSTRPSYDGMAQAFTGVRHRGAVLVEFHAAVFMLLVIITGTTDRAACQLVAHSLTVFSVFSVFLRYAADSRGSKACQGLSGPVRAWLTCYPMFCPYLYAARLAACNGTIALLSYLLFLSDPYSRSWRPTGEDPATSRVRLTGPSAMLLVATIFIRYTARLGDLSALACLQL